MKWVTRRKFNKIATIIGVIALLLATVMGIFTFFGANGNNFVISFAPSENYSIALYTTEDKNVPLTRINFEGLNDMDNTTYPNIEHINIQDGVGSKNDNIKRKYMAFSYYIANLSTVPVNIAISMEITKMTKNVNSAIRVMLLIDDTREIYAKPQEVGENIGQPEHVYGNSQELAIPFVSDSVILLRDQNNNPIKLDANQYKKITVMLWLEGSDAQCIDDIKGGIMRTKMDLWVV